MAVTLNDRYLNGFVGADEYKGITFSQAGAYTVSAYDRNGNTAKYTIVIK